jgi:hypothetical protein
MSEDLTGQEGASLVLNDDGTVSKSTMKNSKKVIGFLGEIVTGKDSITNAEHQQVAWVVSIGDSYHWEKKDIVDNDGNRTTTEIKKATGVKVCNEGGDIEIGDLLVTSSREGYFMKQSDDVIRNYTAAKAGQNVSFGTDLEKSEVYCIMMCG